MVYNHLVKHNGVYYQPGENVPDDEPVVKKVVKVEEPKEEKVTEEKKYSKSEIQLMKVDDLKALANKVGIEVEEKSGNALKKELISYFGL